MPSMDRLQTQQHRLYLLPATVTAAGGGLLGSGGSVRMLVLALGGPPDWATLAPLWRGVQADLGWPAPAIAVNGRDAFELWFSLAKPLAHAEAAHGLALLQRRYLGGVRAERVRLWPTADERVEPPTCPPFAAGPERWAAFLSPDLPAVFGDDSALDVPPGADAQAELLGRQASITAADWQAAMLLLQPAASSAPGPDSGASPCAAPLATLPNMRQTSPTGPTGPAGLALNGPYPDPRSFLHDVMNDATVPVALRIEAAKALLA